MKPYVSAKRLARLAVIALVLGAFALGGAAGYTARSVQAQQEEAITLDEMPAEFGVLMESWRLVQDQFVDQENVDPANMTYGAIQGMLDTLGDENHTVFFSPDVAEQQASALSGSFEGIGAYVEQEDGVFTIVAPINGSPAEEAGILAGDVVVAVDGESILDMPQWEVISLIRGPSGSTVVLTVLHPEETVPVEVEITRGTIELDSVVWTRVPETNVAYLQINQFAFDTGIELRDALTEIQATQDGDNPVAGIVLDLRNNPGGVLQQALYVASQFLDEGEIVLHERDANDEIQTYRARGDGLARDIPMIVLINEGSASAAEILSGAVQANGRARLVGETTVGTGTVLRPFTLSDGSVLRLGVTNWLLPDMQLIKGIGVHPDVPLPQDAAVRMIDTFALDEAAATDSPTSDVRSFGDRQFNTALFLLQREIDEVE